MTISASHLHFLQPRLPEYTRAIAVHLDGALSGFRASLNASTLSQQQPDAIMACGFILLHYAWSVPFFNAQDDKSTDIESDGLLWFAAGVKTVILAVFEKMSAGGIFHAYMRKDYVRQFYLWSENSGCSYNFEQNFLGRARKPLEIPEGCCPRPCGTTDAEERLVPIFHSVDALTRGRDISDMMPSILAYSLMWPSKAQPAFEDEIKMRSLPAMVTLLCFYACSWQVLPESAWWAHRRSKVMCEGLLAHLSREKPSRWDRNVSFIADYFGFSRKGDGNWEVTRPATVTNFA